MGHMCHHWACSTSLERGWTDMWNNWMCHMQCGQHGMQQFSLTDQDFDKRVSQWDVHWCMCQPRVIYILLPQLKVLPNIYDAYACLQQLFADGAGMIYHHHNHLSEGCTQCEHQHPDWGRMSIMIWCSVRDFSTWSGGLEALLPTQTCATRLAHRLWTITVIGGCNFPAMLISL